MTFAHDMVRLSQMTANEVAHHDTCAAIRDSVILSEGAFCATESKDDSC